MKLLFLASWYPEDADSRNGLFIWQHAQAAALLPGAEVVLAAATASQHHTALTLEQSEKNGVAHWVVRYPAGGAPWLQAWRYFQAWKLLRKNYVQQFGQPSAILVNVLWRAGLIAWWWKQRWGWKYSILEHWSGYLPNGLGFDRWWQVHLSRMIGRAAEKVAGVSEALVQGMRSHGLSDHLVVVPNVVDSNSFYPDSEVTRSKHLLHVSNLAPEKNFQFVLEVWQAWRKLHPDAELWVAGAISHHLIQPYQKLDGLVFLGFLEAQQLAQVYRQAYALLMPSKFETFSMVSAEALACGIPVLATELEALRPFKVWGLSCLPLDAAVWLKELQSTSLEHPSIDSAAVLRQFAPSQVALQLQQLMTHERV